MNALKIETSFPVRNARIELTARLFIALSSGPEDEAWRFYVHRIDERYGTTIIVSGNDHATPEEAHAAALAELAGLRDELLEILPRST